MTSDTQRARTEANKKAWLELQSQSHDQADGHVIEPTILDAQTLQTSEDHIAIFVCLSQALRWYSAGRDPALLPSSPEAKSSAANPPLDVVSEASHVQVLVTGSLHLVGAAMNTLGCSVDEL